MNSNQTGGFLNFFKKVCGYSCEFTKQTYDSYPSLLFYLLRFPNTVDIHCQDDNGNTLLHLSLLNREIDLFYSIIQHIYIFSKFSVLDIQNNEGNTALHLAVKIFGNSNKNIPLLLVKLGASTRILNNENEKVSLPMTDYDDTIQNEMIYQISTDEHFPHELSLIPIHDTEYSYEELNNNDDIFINVNDNHINDKNFHLSEDKSIEQIHLTLVPVDINIFNDNYYINAENDDNDEDDENDDKNIDNDKDNNNQMSIYLDELSLESNDMKSNDMKPNDMKSNDMKPQNLESQEINLYSISNDTVDDTIESFIKSLNKQEREIKQSNRQSPIEFFSFN